MRQVSIGAKIKQLAGLIGTKDVTDWEDEFLSDVVGRTAEGDRTSMLSEKQIEVIDRLYRKNFA